MALQELHIVNADPKYSRASLIEPTTLGYLLVAAEVQPRAAPFLPNGREKTALLARLREIARQVEQLDEVEKVTLFDGIVFAPPGAYVRERAGAAGVPRYDVVVLVEARSPTAARDVQETPAYRALLDTLSAQAKSLRVVAARDAKRIGDVDKRREGVFLFNYFVGDDPNVVLDLWDYLAGWYTVETGLDNSTLLVPLEGERSEYVAINNARWDGSLLSVFLRQISKRTFRTYLLANMDENHVGALPMLYRLADLPPRPTGARPASAWLAGAAVLGAAALGARLAVKGLRRR